MGYRLMLFGQYDPVVTAQQGNAGLIRPEDCPTLPQSEKSKDNDRSWAFKEIFDSNEWSSPESKSGKGSEMRYTGEFQLPKA